MNFSAPLIVSLMDQWRQAKAEPVKAEAANLDFDEHLSIARVAFFEGYAGNPTSIEEMRKSLVDYYIQHVMASRDVPHPFANLNSGADAGHLSEEQTIVRLEDLREVLEKTGVTFELLKRAHSIGDENFTLRFLDEWNSRPDIKKNKCSFATFKDELIDELNAPSWEEKLRDCLGLVHLNPIDESIPVALFEYHVADVMQNDAGSGSMRSFAIPTTFDGRPNAHFFPTTTDFSYGHPMNLKEVEDDDQLKAEVLHQRIPYRPKHLKRLGTISTLCPHSNLRALRNAHLWALRIAAGREDIGEEMS